MPDDPNLIQRLTDMLPWNRKKARDREQLERELMALETEPAPPAASAAEAMEAMRRESKARSAPRSASEPPPDDEPVQGELHDRWRDTASKPTSNEALRDYGRKRGH